MGEPAVELEGVWKRFGAVAAVDGLDLEIVRGETVALLGTGGPGTLGGSGGSEGDAGRAGSGLVGLAERVRAVGGRVDARAVPAGGFALTVAVPLAVGEPATDQADQADREDREAIG
jgi:hypothetical protein